MKKTARYTSLAIVMSLISASALNTPSFAQLKLIPVVSGSFTTGQWYFEGEESSLGGNANLTVIPALKFSNKFSIIPIFETNYRGTRSAQELAGGNNLFQDTWENAARIKGVHKLGRGWKFRENFGARTKYIRETSEESIGKGLYDHEIFNVGAEIEHAWSKRTSVALGFDISSLRFPNYNSIESQQNQDLAREFSGSDVHDTMIQLATMRTKIPLIGRIQSGLQGFYSPRDYSDQHVVDFTGLLTATKRQDKFTGASLTLERIFKVTSKSHLLPVLSAGYTSLDSNQNHYDAQQTTYIDNYYDYDQVRLASQFSYAYGSGRYGPMVFDLGVSYARKDYRGRVVQNSGGSYLTDKLYVKETAINLGYSYPLSRFFRLRTSATFGRSKSNNDYEDLYRYNFSNSTYQFGFSYEY